MSSAETTSDVDPFYLSDSTFSIDTTQRQQYITYIETHLCNDMFDTMITYFIEVRI